LLARITRAAQIARVKTKVLFFAALAAATAQLCSAQTSTSTASQSGWQLGGAPQTQSTPFLPNLSLPNTPNPSATAAAAIVETAPKQPVYTEGASWVMTFVKTKAGSTDDYLKSIIASLKPIYDEEKKQKIILDYKILRNDGDMDFNVVILVEYPNPAALENLRERTDPIVDKILGPADKRREVAAKRSDIREILASKTMREISLK
jgi:hypothetical protein